MAFLRKYGPLDTQDIAKMPTRPLPLSRFQTVRKDHEAWLLGEFEPVFSGSAGNAMTAAAFIKTMRQIEIPPMHLSLNGGLEGRLVCKNVQAAINAAAFISRAEGYEWKRCGWENCDAPFRVKGKRTTYCSPKCAQRQAAQSYSDRKG